MSKGSVNGEDPAVSWYWNDWMGGTATFTRHLKGCYMDLLHAQFNNGALSLDEIKTVLGSDFGLWSTLQKKFKQDESGLFYNNRLRLEVIKRKGFNKSRKDNLSGKNDSHMGIENGNDYGIEIVKVIELLNLTIGADFRKTAKKNVEPIRARLNEGFTYPDFELVIAHKWQMWGQDQHMKQFLRPETLFGNKFEGYLETAKIRTASKIESVIHASNQQDELIKQKYNRQ